MEASILTTNDPSAQITKICVWSELEGHVAVIAACLPTIRPVFRSKVIEDLKKPIRSALSSRSMNSWQHRLRSDSDLVHHEPALILDGTGKGSLNKMRPSVDTKITGHRDRAENIPANAIYLEQGIRVREERV